MSYRHAIMHIKTLLISFSTEFYVFDTNVQLNCMMIHLFHFYIEQKFIAACVKYDFFKWEMLFSLQDGPDGDSNLELQKILPLINRLNFRNNEDLAYFLNSYGGGSSNNALSGGGWGEERLFRSPEMKRQIRYRQCYFNPISCFRK